MELLVTPMPVIALAGFIAITEHARIVYDIRQTVLEGMRRARQWNAAGATEPTPRILFSARTIH